MEPLRKAIAAVSTLSEESMNAFIKAWKHWSTTKDQFLLKENTVSDYIYFIEKGVARIYYYKNGKEITEWIALDDQFFLSITSFFMIRISGDHIYCLAHRFAFHNCFS